MGILDRPIVRERSALDREIVQEAFLPGGGGDGEVTLAAGDQNAPDGSSDGVPMISPGSGLVGAPSQRVRVVQGALKSLGHYSGAEDGIYGPATVSAVQEFQSRTGGLRAHGHVDGATLQALDRQSDDGVWQAVNAAES